MKKNIKKFINTIIQDNDTKYKIIDYIASGSFGNVFKAIKISEGDNKSDNDKDSLFIDSEIDSTTKFYALKIPVKHKSNSKKLLYKEYTIYNDLNNHGNGYGIPKIKFIKESNILVMDLFEESLENILKCYNFSLKELIQIIISMIKSVKFIHSCGYIHRDIKPDNFVYGNKQIYCIDYGLATKYIDSDGSHLPLNNIHNFCGTGRYASISAHLHKSQSRKDDLESIGYSIIYLFNKKLPWEGIKTSDKTKKYKLIGDLKQNITIDELCKGMPNQFHTYMKYVLSLEFSQKPHYTSLINMFIKLYKSL